MNARLMWEHDGRDWPNRSASRFIWASGLEWHAQVAGDGPTLLLLHGTGASSHSWRDLFPALAQRFYVVAPDLPGHGFTRASSSNKYGLEGMAKGVADLLRSHHELVDAAEQEALAPAVLFTALLFLSRLLAALLATYASIR